MFKRAMVCERHGIAGAYHNGSWPSMMDTSDDSRMGVGFMKTSKAV